MNVVQNKNLMNMYLGSYKWDIGDQGLGDFMRVLDVGVEGEEWEV